MCHCMETAGSFRESGHGRERHAPILRQCWPTTCAHIPSSSHYFQRPQRVCSQKTTNCALSHSTASSSLSITRQKRGRMHQRRSRHMGARFASSPLFCVDFGVPVTIISAVMHECQLAWLSWRVARVAKHIWRSLASQRIAVPWRSDIMR